VTVRGRAYVAIGLVLTTLASATVTYALLAGDGPPRERGSAGDAVPSGAGQTDAADATAHVALGALGPLMPPVPSADETSRSVDPVAPRPRTATPVRPRSFDASAAMATIRDLEGFGVRAGGSDAERRAAEYLAGRLREMGLVPRIEEFGVPGGTSRNVIARIGGTSDAVLVLGAHYDSKPPSFGANDNGSGCAVVLEVAAVLAERPATPTVEIVFFGSEEIIGGDKDAHHFGSRHRVTMMSAAEQANTAGMLSVDMIGVGPDFHSRTMGVGPATASDLVLARARALGIPMTYRRDTSATGLSDHEAYEKVGIPVSCVARRTDPAYHTTGDVAGHVSKTHVATAGTLVLEFVRGLGERELAALLDR